MTTPLPLIATEPRKTARQSRAVSTVEAIVEAAARILEASGTESYTTNNVAKRAGVSVGSLYQYFPNKDAITRALINREFGRLIAEVDAIDAGATQTDPMDLFVTAVVAHQLRRPALAELLEDHEGRLIAPADIEPMRTCIGTKLKAILLARGNPASPCMIEDILDLTCALLNSSAMRAERDASRLAMRIHAVIDGRLSVE